LPAASGWLVHGLGGLPGERAFVLSQLGGGPSQLLGYVAAGLELAAQVARGECPEPDEIVLPIGSAATSGGLWAGLALARHLGLGLRRVPRITAVRIAAWPLSRRRRVLGLAQSAIAHLASQSGEPRLHAAAQELGERFEVVGDELGDGYPHATPRSLAACARFASAGLPILDGTYSGKAAAHLLGREPPRAAGPVLFWCTKSSVELPGPLSSATS
jgi:D-cysteine desulfhydrase